MRVLTLNIRFGAGGRFPEKPGYDISTSEKKLSALADAIRSVDPDIIALQEVRNARQARRIAELLGMHHAYAAHPTSYAFDFFEWGLATIFRSTLIRFDSWTLIFDPVIRSGRLALVTELQLANMPMTVVNVHLESRAVHQQAEMLLSLISAINSPLVIAGDFNCPAEDPALSPLRTRMVDTCSAVDVTGAREADAVGTTILHNLRIDHIFFDPRYLSVSHAGLLPEGYRRVSDHIGYHADFFMRD